MPSELTLSGYSLSRLQLFTGMKFLPSDSDFYVSETQKETLQIRLKFSLKQYCQMVHAGIYSVPSLGPP